MRPKIIGFTGAKTSGKTTAAMALQHSKWLPKKVGIMSFAQTLKGMARLILPREAFLPENKEDVTYGICGRTPRYVMQTLGTEWGREMVGNDLWLEVMRRNLANTTFKTVIVDDVRFNNEAELIIDLGGVIYEIQRVGLESSGDTHASERGVDDRFLKGVIINTGLESLRARMGGFDPL